MMKLCVYALELYSRIFYLMMKATKLLHDKKLKYDLERHDAYQKKKNRTCEIKINNWYFRSLLGIFN